MQVVREAAPDLHLVGCGAPLLPSVGWIDSMRTGADIAFSIAPTARYPFIAAEARNTALRAFTDHFWALDPDVVLLRGEEITEVEAYTAVVSAALSGGNYLLGDPRQADARRLALAVAPALLELTRDRVAARPLDAMAHTDEQIYPSPLLDLDGATAPPHLWQKRSADGRRIWFALFAWNERSFAQDLSLPAGAEEIVPQIAPELGVKLVPVGGTRSFAVPLHGVRLFRVQATSSAAY